MKDLRGIVRACEPAQGETEGGQSLLEVLISILFMGAILLMSMNFLTSGIRGNSRGREMSAAAYYGQDILEEMKMVDYEDLAEFDGFVTGGGLPGNEPAQTICREWEDGITSELASGRGEINVVTTSSSRARISVIISWLDELNKQRQVRYETLISNRN